MVIMKYDDTILIVGFCQATVVRKVDNTIHVTDQYLVDSMVCFVNTE